MVKPPPYRPFFPRTDFPLKNLIVFESCWYISVYNLKSFYFIEYKI